MLKRIIKKIPYFDFFYSRIRANKSVYWKKLNKNINYSNSRPDINVLMATSLGDYEMGTLLESSLSSALRLRNSKVDVLLCDSALSGCQMSKIETISPDIMAKEGPASRCSSCINYGKNIFEGAVDNKLYYSDFITPDEYKLAERLAKKIPYDDIKSYKYDDLSIGEHAYAGALRYYARGDLNEESFGEQILRRYLRSALLTAFCLNRILEDNTYDVVCFHHGIYVPQGIITQVCQKKNIRLVTWNPAYKSKTFIFSHYDSYHHTMISEDVERWKDIKLDASQENAIKEYLRSRRHGTNDWIWFHDTPEENAEKIKDELGCSFDKPSIGLFTNVMWDAQLHYESNAFDNMLDWVFSSIDYFSERSDLELFIRIHPAEIRGAIPSRQPLLTEIKRKYKTLPNNIFLISPESQISTYALMDKCNAVAIYNTKTGIEVASEGIPTIVAGEAWIRGKGFAIDVNSKEEYFKILSELPFKSKMSKEKQIQALKYAYHFFMRRMIPIPFIEFDSKTGLYSSSLESAEKLKPGNFKGLDLVCDGIINGSPFEYDERLSN
tara:strand:- start:181 stop:1836 length:1656 start_codon:yes stop_codon:yes gene_type:complete